ncbi:uncharacterized protein LOC110027378 [Phalaenopsis equestris]|uniref:uncharacterized protein LOC110027378 n=1 Tax=Phalaenopsis equestris TaxID=78828 RepID=UPI0009E4BD3E|nr:uncharacterized protein LOC110027378 [Phalaenopsis equestris]
MVGHGHQIPLEVVGTMIEMADVAWNAIEHRRERKVPPKGEEEVARIRSENQRLKTLLAENLSILQGISQASSLARDCPPDLYARLLAVVDTPNFLATLESLNLELECRPDGDLLFTKDQDMQDVLISGGEGNPNRWVLVKHDMDPDSTEEASGIDDENYVVISEENVVDGLAIFIGRCVLENPISKTMSPQEIQKAVAKALGEIRSWGLLKNVWEAGKVIYTLSIWGIFLAGLYRHRAIVKAAARGATSSAKFILKAL